MKFIKIDNVLEMTAMSRTTLYQRIKDGDFPEQIKLGSRSSVWYEDAVLDWMNTKIKQAVKG
ncbi:MAG: hypothetical protein RLZZ66_191 [Pseudomonadota bacterium]|jgi:prophage regulatory protein